MRIESGSYCPLVGGDCKRLACRWFIQLRGKHPQTGEPLDEWDCAVRWLPLLLIEGAQETRQTAAAIESFRNEVVRQNAELLEHAAQEMIEHGDSNHHRR